MSPDFWNGVAVALVVSVIANLVTPMTRTVLLAVVVRFGNWLKVFGVWGLRRSLINSERELAQLDDFHVHPGKFEVLAVNVMALNLFVVWVIVIALGIAIFGGWIPSRDASNGFFGLLGASTSIFGHLLVTQSVAARLQSYDRYRSTLLKRIELLKAATGTRGSEG